MQGFLENEAKSMVAIAKHIKEEGERFGSTLVSGLVSCVGACRFAAIARWSERR
jgi:hypothetical protein